MRKDNQSFDLITLDSGARILNVYAPNLPLSVVSVWFKAGARFDPFGKEGLAHFFEHILMTRTEKYSDRKERMKRLSLNGIDFGAYTTNETAHYFNMQLGKDTEKSLSLLIDGLNNTIFKEEYLEIEKGIILDEESRNRNDPNEYIWRISQQALWPKSNLGRGFFGDQKTISSITIKDIKNFFHSLYKSDNAIFVVVGQEDTEKIKEQIEREYQPIGKGVKFEKEIFLSPQLLNIEHRDIDQIVVSVNYRTSAASNTEDNTVLNFIKTYLANSWTSMLTERLRMEQDITYWVSGVTDNFSDTGFLRFNFSTKPEKVQTALDIIFEEIEKIKNGKIKAEYFEATKKIYSFFLARNNSIDPADILWWYGYAATVGEEILTVSQYTNKVNVMTPNDVQEIANKYLKKENLSVSMIGPIKESDVKFM